MYVGFVFRCILQFLPVSKLFDNEQAFSFDFLCALFLFLALRNVGFC